MTRNTAAPGAAQAFVEQRRARICRLLGHAPEPVGLDVPLSAERLAHLRSEAEELYWNELVWEELTDEEAITGGGHMTEMVFPGFLAFIDGLLVDRVPADALSPARPHPDAVEDILTFVAERHFAATRDLESGADSQKVVWARMMAAELLDLVLYRLYRLSPAEVEELGDRG